MLFAVALLIHGFFAFFFLADLVARLCFQFAPAPLVEMDITISLGTIGFLASFN